MTSRSGIARPPRPMRWSRLAPRPRPCPRDVAAAAGIIFMCLTDAAAVEDGGVRPRRHRGGARRRQAGRRLLVDPSGRGPRHRRTAEGRQRHGMDRCAGLRRHQGRGGRHARGDGRRRCRRHRAGAALCAGDGATAHAYGPDRRGPDHQTLQPGDRRLRHGGAGGSDTARGQCRDRRRPAAGSAGRRLCRFHPAAIVRAAHGAGHSFAAARPYRDHAERSRYGGRRRAQTPRRPVPMSALAAQLFRLAKAARGADADALEIYKLSAKQRTPGHASRPGNDGRKAG